MPASDLALLTEAALLAGKIAVGFAQGENRVWEKAPDDPVTEADHAVDAFLHEHLRNARPDYGWLSEETEDGSERLGAARVFVVDPIDGTRAFIAGEKSWAHSIAVVEDGRPVAGVVYLPMLEKIYAASVGDGASLNDRPIRPSAADGLQDATVLASRPAFEDKHWQDGVPPIKRTFRPSLAYRLSLVAEGRFDAMLTLRDSWEWDLAAGALVALEAGATVTDRFGHALRFNNPHPMTRGVLAAAPGLHPKLAGRLREPARNGP